GGGQPAEIYQTDRFSYRIAGGASGGQRLPEVLLGERVVTSIEGTNPGVVEVRKQLVGVTHFARGRQAALVQRARSGQVPAQDGVPSRRTQGRRPSDRRLLRARQR